MEAQSPFEKLELVQVFAFLTSEQIQNSVCSTRRLKAEGKEKEISIAHFPKLCSHV